MGVGEILIIIIGLTGTGILIGMLFGIDQEDFKSGSPKNTFLDREDD